MVRLTIATAEVRKGGMTNGKGESIGWSVVQGGGGLILAYCDSEAEAEATVRMFVSLGTMRLIGTGLQPIVNDHG